MDTSIVTEYGGAFHTLVKAKRSPASNIYKWSLAHAIWIR